MAIIDTSTPFSQSGKTITSFPYNAVEVLPSDEDVFSEPVTIYVGGGGPVYVMTAGGQDAYFIIPTGGFVPVLVKMVYASSTTATNMMALY